MKALQSKLGLFSSVMMVMGSLIGSGVFKKIAPMSLLLHSGQLILASWIVAGIITIFGALTFAEVSGRIAQTGGMFQYLRIMFGRPAGFIYGWSCLFVIQSASIASLAHVFSQAASRVFPSVIPIEQAPFLAAGAVVFLTALNCFGVDVGAWFGNVFTLLKIVGILTVTALAISWGHGTPDNFCLACRVGTPDPFSVSTLPLFFAAMMGAFWAYDGINNISFIGGEVRDPKRNIPLALIFGVAAVLVLYVTVNFAFLWGLPLDKIESIAGTQGKVFAIELAQTLGGNFWGTFVSLLIMVSALGAANSSTLSSSRIYYAMAKENLFFKAFAFLHPKYQAPVVSLVIQCLWACVLIFSGSFDQLTDLLIFAGFIFYAMGALGLFRLRKLNIGTPIFRVPSLIAGIYILFCGSLVIVNIVEEPIKALIGLGLMALGLPVYFLFQKTT